MRATLTTFGPSDVLASLGRVVRPPVIDVGVEAARPIMLTQLVKRVGDTCFTLLHPGSGVPRTFEVSAGLASEQWCGLQPASTAARETDPLVGARKAAVRLKYDPSDRPSASESELDLHVLFVCTGNICRSPTAERLANAYAQQMALTNFVASSAGTHAVISHPIHWQAARVLAELGGDGSDFLARQLTAKIANSADLILTMTRAHRDRVLELAPKMLQRTFTIVEASRLVAHHGVKAVEDLAGVRWEVAAEVDLDVMDPIGHGPEVFASVGELIAELLPPLLGLAAFRDGDPF